MASPSNAKLYDAHVAAVTKLQDEAALNAEPSCPTHGRLCRTARYYARVPIKNNPRYIYVFDDKIITKDYRYSRRDDDITQEDPAELIATCGIEITHIARTGENPPVLCGKLHGLDRVVDFVLPNSDLHKRILSEGYSCVPENTLKALITVVISDIYMRHTFEEGIEHVGIYLNDDRLNWEDGQTGRLLVPAVPAVVEQQKTILKRFATQGNAQDRQKYFAIMRRYLDGLPAAWRAHHALAVCHGLYSHLARVTTANDRALGALMLVGARQTVKTPALKISNALFGRGAAASGNDTSSMFRAKVSLSVPGPVWIDEKINADGFLFELIKAAGTANIDPITGRPDGSVMRTPIVGVIQNSTNSDPLSEIDDDGAGFTSRIIRIHVREHRNSRMSDTFKTDLTALTGRTAPAHGKWLIDNLIENVNTEGYAHFADQITAIATSIEDSMHGFAKRAETVAGVLACEKIIRDAVLADTGVEIWPDSVASDIKSLCVRGDENDNESDRFLSFVSGIIQDYAFSAWDRRSSPAPPRFIFGPNRKGVFVDDDGEHVLISAETIREYYATKRMQPPTLKDFADTMGRFGLKMEESREAGAITERHTIRGLRFSLVREEKPAQETFSAFGDLGTDKPKEACQQDVSTLSAKMSADNYDVNNIKKSSADIADTVIYPEKTHSPRLGGIVGEIMSAVNSEKKDGIARAYIDSDVKKPELGADIAENDNSMTLKSADIEPLKQPEMVKIVFVRACQDGKYAAGDEVVMERSLADIVLRRGFAVEPGPRLK